MIKKITILCLIVLFISSNIVFAGKVYEKNNSNSRQGAAPDSWFSHIAVEVDGVETENVWLEPVGDDEYSKLK